MEWIYWDGVGEFLCDGGLVLVKPSIATTSTLSLQACPAQRAPTWSGPRPRLATGLGVPARIEVRSTITVAYLSPRRCVPPHMLIDTDHHDAVGTVPGR